MSFNTFGYNAVFEMRKEVVDKLLAQVYERNMVETDGVTPNDEFVTIDLGEVAGKKVVIYLRIGILKCDYDSAAQTDNTVNLTVPLDIAIWQGESQVVGKTSSDEDKFEIVWTYHPLNDVELKIDKLTLAKETSGGKDTIRPDFKNLTAEQLHFFTGTLEVDDQKLDALLMAKNLPLATVDLKAKIEEQLKGGVLKNIDIEVPNAGNEMKWIQNWDFQIISNKEQLIGATYDGIDLLLYESDTAGKGLPNDATNTIPQPVGAPYGFALSIRKDVLIDKYFEDLLDQKEGYFNQNGVLNTTSNPFGYMVVSAKGQTLKYSLPAPPKGVTHTVTVSAPVNGEVDVTIPADGLTPGSRAYLNNLDTGAQVDFSADGSGAATVTIKADKNHRLGIKVYALGLPGHPDTRIWRPQFSLHDGKLRLEFHYYHEIKNWCDAEGDGWVEIGLKVDRSNVFKLGTTILDKHVDLPWWADVAGFLADFLTGGLVNGIAATILIEVLGTQMVSEFVATQIDKNLQSQLKFPVPGSGKLALFLERVDLYQTGVVFSGYADAGLIQYYGRHKFKVEPKVLVIGSGKEGFSIHLQQSVYDEVKVSSYYPVAVFSGADILEQFWKADYQKGSECSFANTTPSVHPGTPAAIWVQRESGLAKVLLEWETPENSLCVSWISYKPWATPYVKIEDNIARIACSINKMGVLYISSYSYNGYLKIDARKHLRTELVRQGGFEHWKWDGQDIPQDGTVTQPGISVTWDTKSDRVYVVCDQTSMNPLPGKPRGPFTVYSPEAHMVEYESIDVFGKKLSAQYNLYMPSGSCETKKPLYKLLLFKHEILPDPPWMERFGDEVGLWVLGYLGEAERLAGLRQEEIAQYLMESLRPLAGDYPYTWRLADILAAAFKEGKAQIDADSAELLLNLFVEREQK